LDSGRNVRVGTAGVAMLKKRRWKKKRERAAGKKCVCVRVWMGMGMGYGDYLETGDWRLDGMGHG
jgi:hypothetical protein